MLFSVTLYDAATAFLTQCRAQGIRVVTAESCTGGLIAALLTEISGSSDIVDHGFVTYSNTAKMRLLGVEESVLARHGAVSAECARQMAQGALAQQEDMLALAVTGVAGPGGGTLEKPVGLVYVAARLRRATEQDEVTEHRFSGDRSAVRLQTVTKALALGAMLLARAP